MNHIYQTLFCIIFSVITLSIQAQTPATALHTKNKKSISLYQQAEALIQQRKFNEAITILNTIITKDPTFPEPYFKVGSIFMLMGNKTDAKAYFCKGSDVAPDVKSFAGAYYTAGELSYNEGEYDKAKTYFNYALNVQPTDKRILDQAPVYLSKCDFALNLMKNPVAFSPVKMPDIVNSSFAQSHPVLTADGKTMYYTSLSGLTRLDHEDIVMSTFSNGQWSVPKSISDKLNTKDNEGTCTISMDGNTLVFVCCGRADGLGSCDLYISKKTNGQWSSPINLGSSINSSTWDSHPSLSADGRTLYFISARKGGFGKEDIYFSHLLDDGQWSQAMNAGKTINTSASEFSPFIHADGTTLYFSSNGLPGMGGLDLFYSKGFDTSWTTPVNMGYPLNTSKNDETLFITLDGKKGYYSRSDGTNVNFNSRIFLYEFDMPDSFKPEKLSTFAEGHIYDEVTRNPIGSKIELFDLASAKVVQSVLSDSITGEYTIVLTEGKEYALYISSKGYLFESLNFDYNKPAVFNPVTLDAYLKPIKAGANVALNNIFFATNSFTLEDKSLTELKKLVVFMNSNPAVKVELSGHTDNIGSSDANMKLSTQRAKAVSDYLITNGISATRIVYKGYAALKPIADNETEEGRQKNRRLEIKIL